MNLKSLLYSLLALAAIVLTIFSWSAYSYYTTIHADDPTNPFLSVTLGSAKIVRDDTTYELIESESYDLEERDIVETTKESRASIIWPDRSVTRLGGGTRIVIRKMLASDSYDDIQIAYDMERGKVWNTIIRTLVGNSYFEVNLPKESVVAGVRGTVFEINLESRYIHAVDHVTALTDKTGGILSLLPGELVDSENIWVKKGREWLDTTWNDWNTVSDAAYQKLRSLEIEKRIESLTRSGGLDRVSRALLSQIRGFEDIEIAALVKSGDMEKLKAYSVESLISFSQRIPDITRTEDREKLRSAILSRDIDAKLRETLEMRALWDALDTGRLSDQAKIYLESKGVNLSEFQTKFTEGVKQDTKKLLESMSGSLDRVFGF